jgi:hypothetical protein
MYSSLFITWIETKEPLKLKSQYECLSILKIEIILFVSVFTLQVDVNMERVSYHWYNCEYLTPQACHKEIYGVLVLLYYKSQVRHC